MSVYKPRIPQACVYGPISFCVWESLCIIWCKILSDLLKLWLGGLDNRVKTGWCRLGSRKSNTHFFCLSLSKHRYVLFWRGCMCVRSCILCLPQFSPSILLSPSVFLFHLLLFNVSLLIWRWLCLPWCTSPRQQGPPCRAGAPLPAAPLAFFLLPFIMSTKRWNNKKSQNQESQCAK